MRRLLATAFWTAVICLALCSCSRGDRAQPVPAGEDKRYAAYSFGGAEVLDLGSQPLTLPEGAVAELLSRDRVLAARLAAAGVSLRVHPFFKGKDIVDYLASRKLDGGIFADMPALTAAAGGQYVMVALLKQGCASIVSKKPMLVRELAGKRVATGLGSAAHFTLLSALQDEGLGEGDLKLVSMDVSQMPQALEEGGIDAFSAWEPTPALAFAIHPDFRLVHKGTSFGFLCLRREFVRNHPEAAKEVAAAVARACAFMRKPSALREAAGWSAEAAKRLQGQPWQLGLQSQAAIIRADLLDVPAAPRIPGALLHEEGLLYRKFTFLKRIGKIPESTSWSRVSDSFDTEMMREVMARGDSFDLQRFDYRSSDQPGGAR